MPSVVVVFFVCLWKGVGGGGVRDYERVYYTKSNSLAFINYKVKDPCASSRTDTGLKLFITLCIL